jgi:polysaccharide deacetylase family protein (PEP-CTERM system associated)
MTAAIRILTVDVEDWFHILDNAETMTEAHWSRFPSRVETGTARLLDLFDRHKQKATFIILGYIARNHPEVVREIAGRGHEVATHGDMHQLVYDQTPEAFEADLVTSMEAIAAAGGVTPRAYRAPGFSITSEAPWAFDILARNGVEVDASVYPALRAHGGLPGFPEARPCLIETGSGRRLRAFPMSLGRIGPKSLVCSGGGFFRITPGPLLDRLFARGHHVMTYFHLRDFDPDPPVAPWLSRARRFKSYVGLAGAFNKLDRLLGTLDFVNLGEAEEQIDWTCAPVVTMQ